MNTRLIEHLTTIWAFLSTNYVDLLLTSALLSLAFVVSCGMLFVSWKIAGVTFNLFARGMHYPSLAGKWIVRFFCCIYLRMTATSAIVLPEEITPTAYLIGLNGIAYLTITVKGETKKVLLEPWMTMNLSQRVGKEAVMAESDVFKASTPNHTFSIWNNAQFVGCGFRMIIAGTTYLVTARHVFDKLIVGETFVQKDKHRRAIDFKLIARGGDLTDFVLLEDSYTLHSFGVKILKPANFRPGVVQTLGTSNGNEWHTACGKAIAGDRAFQIHHQSSTSPGWSGSPMLRDGRVIGLHTGSYMKDGRIVNEGTAIVDLLRVLIKRTTGRTLESLEDYEANYYWHEQAIKTSGKRERMMFNDIRQDFTLSSAGYAWADAEDIMDYDDLPAWGDYGTSTGESALPAVASEESEPSEPEFTVAEPGFLPGLATLDAQLTPINSEPKETMTSTSTERNKRRRLRRKAKASSALLDLETAQLPLGEPVQPTLSINSSPKQSVSDGPIVRERASSIPSDSTAASLSKNDEPLQKEFVNELLRKLSQRSNEDTTLTANQMVCYLVTGQHLVKKYYPDQLRKIKELESSLRGSLPALQQLYQAKRLAMRKR